jgi:hypothetical protein
VATDHPTRVVTALAAWAAAAAGESKSELPELPELSVSRPTLEDTYLKLIADHEGTLA